MTKEPKEKRKRSCPYCEQELLAAELPFCQPCSVTLRFCASCEKPVPRDAKVCPECGAPLGEEATSIGGEQR